MKNNFQQFEKFGNPWCTPASYVQEERDAADPMCSTGRRRSARQYVEIRASDQLQKSHNMCFSDNQPAPPPKVQSATARVLAIRNRLAQQSEPDPAALADWQVKNRVFVSKPAARSDADSGSVSESGFKPVSRPFLDGFRGCMSDALRAHIAFEYYSSIVHHYGSVDLYLHRA